ncbi:MAG: PDZ domain-containing protein [Pirellulaceae bacterium]
MTPRHLLTSFVACWLALAALLPAQDDLAGLEEQAMRAAVATVAPSVVKIETIGGLERVGEVLIGTGPTTGLIVSPDGYIVSSAFNFIQQPTSILVSLPGGHRAAAQIVARDHSRMLVLLKVDAPQALPVPVAAPRDEMSVGQWAIAVGRTYDQPVPNLSVGILSALNRVWGKAIQTDAKISPANYGGPLVDIRGRVLGVLVPLSPQGQASEVAGAEWYNSGIGFAVPLAEINARLDVLKAGKDLHPGLLGISLKPGDIYSLPAEIAASQPGSPAYKAGLKAGDTIVEIDDKKIARQAQLKHVLGTHYAGDKVQLVLTRGETRVEATVELTDKLLPYRHPFLGILPLRDASEAGVAVRYVYPESSAAQAGVHPGDRIVALAGAPLADATTLRTAIANVEPQAKVTLEVVRGEQKISLEVQPTHLPTQITGELPPAIASPPTALAEKPAVGLIEIKLPEETSECLAYVPQGYHPQIPHGLVVVLHAPGPIDRAAFESRWKETCNKHGLIALAPVSAKADKWEPTEATFIRKSLDDVLARYNVDPARIVTYGYQAGGSMAFLVGFANPDRVRGIVAVDAAPPARTKMPDNDPINRVALLVATAEKSGATGAIKRVVARLEAAHFPVTPLSLGEQSRDLTADELLDLGRWIDALDRI